MSFRHSLFAIGAGAISCVSLFAQGRGGGADWATAQMDAQRTASIRSDANISVAAMQGPGFELQWKVKLDNQPRQGESLRQGVTVAGVTLFTPLSIVAGSSNNVYALDNDTGNLFWKKHFEAPLAAAGTAACPGGITSSATRMAMLAPPVPQAGRGGGGGGRGGRGYQSAVGEPGEGVPGQLAVRGGGAGGAGAPGAAGPGGAAAAAPGGAAAGLAAGAAGTPADPNAGRRGGAAGAGRGAAPGAPGAPGAAPGAPAGGPGGPGGGRGGGGSINIVSSDGMLRSLGPASGKETAKPVQLVGAGASVADLTAVDNFVYATTAGKCGGVADGIYAVDINSEAKTVVSWKTNGGAPVGGVAFTADGTAYVAVGAGQAATGGYSNAIVALNPKTLQPKDWFTQQSTEFATGPIVLNSKGREFVAAATKDGRIYLLDPASLGGSNHGTPLYVSRAYSTAKPGFIMGSLTSWEEQLPNPAAAAPAAPAAGVAPGAPVVAPGAATAPASQTPPSPPTLPGQRFLMLTIAGVPADAGLPTTNGAITNGAVLTLKLVEAGGKPSLQPAWVSRDLPGVAPPVTVNGVIFTLSRGSRTAPAMLYAYDGMTGKELWNSAKAIGSFVPSRGTLWAGSGQVYVATFDGNVHAFGFAMNRK